MFFLDKEFAKKDMYRISEKALLTVTIMGGCLGSLIGMYTFHHKTKKNIFIMTSLISLAIWIYILK